MEETVQLIFSKLRGFFPNGEIRQGRNPDVECIRLTLDPINPEHRPLAFYFVSFFASLTYKRSSIFCRVVPQPSSVPTDTHTIKKRISINLLLVTGIVHPPLRPRIFLL
jgi:hypothetical protein